MRPTQAAESEERGVREVPPWADPRAIPLDRYVASRERRLRRAGDDQVAAAPVEVQTDDNLGQQAVMVHLHAGARS